MMQPFVTELIWHAGRPRKIAEPGSTLGLMVDAIVRRFAAAAASPSGCRCCMCAARIRDAAAIRSVTVAIGQSDIDEYRAVVRPYCADCAPHDPDAADHIAAVERGALVLRFHVNPPPSTVTKPRRHAVAA
jgi:hypothetical protein